MNKTIKALLEKALGIRPAPTGQYREDFEEFSGSWTIKEEEAFCRATEDMRKVNEDDWR